MTDNPARSDAKDAFLRAVGWGGASGKPLAGDASNRKYDRVSNGPGGANAVLMDAPPEKGEDLLPFLAVGAHLNDQGLSAPKTYEADLETGFALIEDLGDDLYARVCARAAGKEPKLYENAVDVLAALGRTRPPAKLSWRGTERPLSPYDAKVLMREAMLVVEWWSPNASEAEWARDATAEFEARAKDAFAPIADISSVIVLRDYHAENLLWLPERSDLQRVGLIDYQDALAGHPAYDLVSLLEDARRETSIALQDAMIKRFVETSAIVDEGAFRRDYAILGAQRNLKIIGIFARLYLRDGKAGYLDLIPRVWAHLERDLSHPSLSGLRAFVSAHIPVPTTEALACVRARRA